LSTPEMILKKVKEYIDQHRNRLESQVFCKCGTKLEVPKEVHKAVCPNYMKSKVPVSILKLKHDSNKWGTGRDILIYDIICELDKIINEEED